MSVWGWEDRLRRDLYLSRGTWNNLTLLDKETIREIWLTCKRNDVYFDLSDKPMIAYPGSKNLVSGYFLGNESGMKAMLCVGAQKPVSEWMTILLHESCHMDQWLEGAEVWKLGFKDGKDVYDVLQDWLDGKREFTDFQRQEVIYRCLSIELDCERRTVEKIKRSGMEWYVREYIRKANAYLWSYHMIKTKRRWYSIPPYEVPEILELMPEKLLEISDYCDMTYQMELVFDTKSFSKEAKQQ